MTPLLVILTLVAAQTSQPASTAIFKDVSLIGRASKICQVAIKDGEPYVWLDNHRVLYGKNRDLEHDSPSFVVYDRKGVSTRPVESLNRAASRILTNWLSWELSPNRKRLLIVYKLDGSTVNLDGTGFRELDAQGYHSNNHWLSDNRHWLNAWRGEYPKYVNPYDLSVHDAESKEPQYKIANTESNVLYSDKTTAFGSAKGEMVTVGHNGGNSFEIVASQLHVYRRSHRKKESQTVRSTIELRLNGKLGAIALSRNCQNIAMLQESIGFPLSNPKHRDSRTVLCLWVSEISGKNAKEIGCFIPSVRPRRDWPIYGLRWLPDGKHLSFVYHGELYTVPASGPVFSRFVFPALDLNRVRKAK